MSQAKWIWLNGDFELYHSVQLHTRREEYSCDCPPFWRLSPPSPNACFTTTYHADEADTFRAVSPHRGYIAIDDVRYPFNKDITIPAGDHTVSVMMIAGEGFPCLYINSRYLVTDESWTGDWKADHRMMETAVPVGCEPAYTEPTDDPRVFKFSYDRKDAVKVRKTDVGTLYDFGREMFGILHIEGADATTPIRLSYGESAEEALEYDEALLRETVEGQSSYTFPGRAFRYVCVSTTQVAPLSVWADFEYLPLEYRASFSCNRRNVQKIWNVCAYTLLLNSREFFLDGIKRDRWCWSGDAYQSYMANNYLFFDPAITKRTIIALLGKPPYVQHVNTINDYSMYLIIGAYEYYFATGDKQFIEIYFERLKGLYDFINGRLNEAGYVHECKGDWVFIDWSDLDRGGAMCAEQILLWRCRNAMADLSDLVGLDGSEYRLAADKLRRNILRDFWREDRGAFIDCYTTGLEKVTRHANIFAIMYDFVSPTRARKIARCVLENDEITHITTPYFEFFELNALCKLGKLTTAQKKIESYWGGMVALGATSIWEEFFPNQTGIEHYGMYGMKYGRSQCHAWGGGPIFLLGRYCLGVYPTSAGYATYAVEPNRGMYKHIDGSAPLPEGGQVSVKMDAHTCTVTTTRPGGVLILKGKTYELPVGEAFTVTY